MKILIMLLGFYIIQIIVVFAMLLSEAFESKKEFFFALTPFVIPYIIIKRISELK